MHLRYGLNPHQPATATMIDRPAFRAINGEPSMINLLDASNGWSLVRDARRRLGRPVAASIKHVAPAGVAAAGPVDDVILESWPVDDAPSPVLAAYLRARDVDPRSSYGDLIAVSDEVDHDLARFLGGVISDGIIAPGYRPGTVELLQRKKHGRFLILEADPDLPAPVEEVRQVGGFMIRQRSDPDGIGPELLPADLAADDRDTALLAMITVRHTPSNTVAAARDGAVIAIGAGQQSRVDCTRLVVGKASAWWFRRHPATRSLTGPPGTRRQDRLNLRLALATGDATPLEERHLRDELGTRFPTAEQRADWLAGLDRVIMVHDGAIPFRDNVDHAARIGTSMIIEPGGSTAAPSVEQACAEHGIALIRTGRRLFLH